VVDNVKAVIPGLQVQLPPAITMHTLGDRTITIRRSMEDVKFTLKTLSFPRHPRNIPVLAEFVGYHDSEPRVTVLVGGHVCRLMYLGGYSLDNLSMMALTLSVGFVVDDAIVMLENIVRHMEMGEGRNGGGHQWVGGKLASRFFR